jgi:hypothetical protein
MERKMRIIRAPQIALLVALVGFFQLPASALAQSVKSEAWTCKGKGVIEELTATVTVEKDSDKRTLTGTLKDDFSPARTSDLKTAEDASTRKLVGTAYSGNDDRNYDVQLVPFREDDFDSESDHTETKGKAVVVFGGYADCIGQVADAEVLNCTVKMKR